MTTAVIRHRDWMDDKQLGALTSALTGAAGVEA